MCFPPTEDINDMDYCTKGKKSLKGISMASLNGHSLVRKLDSIKLLLLWSNLDIPCLCKPFLHNSIDDAEISISGYDFIRHDRTAESRKNGGGVLIYYK